MGKYVWPGNILNNATKSHQGNSNQHMVFFQGSEYIFLSRWDLHFSETALLADLNFRVGW